MERAVGATEDGARLPTALVRVATVRPPSLLVALGTLVAVLALSQLWIDPRPVRVQLLTVGVPLVLSTPVLFIATRTGDSPRAGRRQMHSVGLGVVFAAIALGTVALVLWAVTIRAVALRTLYFPAVLSVASGASVGCSAGIIYDEWQATRADLADEVDRTRRLNQRLRVVNRLLRHNVRNALNIAMANLEEIRAGVDRPKLDSAAETCHAALERLHRQADKTGYINKLEDVSPDRTTFDVVDVVEAELEDWAETEPEVTFKRDMAEKTRIRAHPLARVAVSEAIENAVVHNDPEGLEVEVGVVADAETVTVTVADTGSGISETELTPLELDVETALEHSSGVGLWLVEWITDASDGDFELDERPGGGVELRMCFPRA